MDCFFFACRFCGLGVCIFVCCSFLSSCDLLFDVLFVWVCSFVNGFAYLLVSTNVFLAEDFEWLYDDVDLLKYVFFFFFLNVFFVFCA